MAIKWCQDPGSGGTRLLNQKVSIVFSPSLSVLPASLSVSRLLAAVCAQRSATRVSIYSYAVLSFVFFLYLSLSFSLSACSYMHEELLRI